MCWFRRAGFLLYTADSMEAHSGSELFLKDLKDLLQELTVTEYEHTCLFFLVTAATKSQTQSPTQGIRASAASGGMRSPRRRRKKKSSVVDRAC